MEKQGISKLIPDENEKISQYLERVEENKEYYVPYSISYLSDYDIKYYTKNNICQIALEYEVPNGDNTTKQRLILATAPLIKGAETENIIHSTVEGIVSEISEFSSKRSFIEEIGKMQRLGWQVTNEAIDIMQIRKHDKPTEIKRTKFTQDERQTILPEDIKENREAHYERLEEDFICDIESYIVDGYKDLLQYSSKEEVNSKRQEVLEYLEAKQTGELDKTKLLPTIFSSMRPMSESKINNVMETVYRKKLNEYISEIPEEEQEGLPKQKEVIKQYLEQREVYSIIRDKSKDNEQIETAKDCYKSTIMSIETFLEAKRAINREEIRQKVEKTLGIKQQKYVEENIEDEIEIG